MSDPQPLKRHTALQPLSREHLGGLIHARGLTRIANSDPAEQHRIVAAFISDWHTEIAEHFLDEESMLLPLITSPALRERLLAEHDQMRSMVAQITSTPAGELPAVPLLVKLGELLHDHIRWEERTLFESVQNDTDTDTLNALHQHAHRIEQQRPRSRARHTRP